MIHERLALGALRWSLAAAAALDLALNGCGINDEPGAPILTTGAQASGGQAGSEGQNASTETTTGGDSAAAGAVGAIGVGRIGGCFSLDPWDPTLKSVLETDAGTFTDECDADGNLIEYYCFRPEPGEGPQQSWLLSETLDCNGTCVDGACEDHCPKTGDWLEVLTTDNQGQVRFANAANGGQIDCTNSADPADDGYDCNTDIMVGMQLYVAGRSSAPSRVSCLGGSVGTVLVDDRNDVGSAGSSECSYACRVADPG